MHVPTRCPSPVILPLSLSFLQTHLKSIIYGGLDGIITTFATVTSVAGADLSVLVIIVLGIAHLFADGLSMVSDMSCHAMCTRGTCANVVGVRVHATLASHAHDVRYHVMFTTHVLICTGNG